MFRKSILIALMAIVVTLTQSSKLDAWGGYHVGYTHYSPYTGLHHYGYTGVSRGYGDYRYGGYRYGGYSTARYGYYRRY
jgi:hypothetical protein